MPVLAGELVAVVVALACAALAMMLTYLVKAIGNQLPNFSILGVGINIGKWFINLGDDAASWMVAQSKGLWSDVGKLFQATGYIFNDFAYHAVSALSHAFDYADHIVTVTIPNAVSSALGDAKGYAHSLYKDVEGDLSAAVGSLDSTLAGDVKALNSTISRDVTSLGNTITKTAAATLSAAEDYVDSQIKSLRSELLQDITNTYNAVESDLATAKQQIGAAITGVANTAANNLANAESTLEGDIASASQAAANALKSTTATLTGEITNVATTAASEVATAEQEAQQEVGQLATSTASAISSTATTLSGDIATEAQTFAGDLTNLQSVLEAAIASAVGALAVRVTAIEECYVGVCDDSANNFSNLLNQALGLLTFTELAAFIASAVSNPASASAAFSGEVAGLFAGGQSLFDSLLNL